LGDWHIEIRGHGIHDNGRPDDADAIAGDAVKRLVEAGHDVASATFTLTGPARDIMPPKGEPAGEKL
jgi:hypothetical protein